MSKAIYYNVMDGEEPKIIDFDDNLNTFYELCKCRSIDIVTRIVAGKCCHIICDDEARLKEVQKTSIMSLNLDEYSRICGNFILVGGLTNDGDLIGLTENESKDIMRLFLPLTFLTKDNVPENRKVLLVD